MFRNLIFISIFIITFSCATEVKQPEIISEERIEKAPPLVPMEDILYDVYSGESIGKVKFINDELTFVILVEMDETATQKEIIHEVSEESKKVSIRLPPYVGTFSGKNTKVIEDTYFLYGTSSLDKLYVVFHDYNPMYKSIFNKNKPKGEHIYLVSVMDQKTFIKVMKRSEDGFDPIKNLSEVKDHIRTQALIKIEKGKNK